VRCEAGQEHHSIVEPCVGQKGQLHHVRWEAAQGGYGTVMSGERLHGIQQRLNKRLGHPRDQVWICTPVPVPRNEEEEEEEEELN